MRAHGCMFHVHFDRPNPVNLSENLVVQPVTGTLYWELGGWIAESVSLRKLAALSPAIDVVVASAALWFFSLCCRIRIYAAALGTRRSG
jgi:hypothetical protein